MKSLNYILIFTVFSVAVFLISNSLTFDAQTGDKNFDKKLSEINSNALADLKIFKSDISKLYEIEEAEVSNMMSIMEPAEIILTLEISKTIGKSISDIENEYTRSKNLGWSKILINLGIPQNSTKFRNLMELRNYQFNPNETTISKK